MPCDTIQTSTVDFRPENFSFLQTTLESLGYEVRVENNVVHAEKTWGESVTLDAGRLDVQSRSGVTTDTIKQAYSRTIVEYAAQEFGFELAKTSENEYEVSKESF